MLHFYEGVAVVKVKGVIEADSSEEARELLYSGEYGEILETVLQPLTLMDDLDPIEEEEK